MSDTLEVKDLRLVRAIATAGGVSHASRGLHLSQSAVSHHLARLEERLGVQLFERVGRRLEIASAGRRLVALADEVLPKLRATEVALRAPQLRTLRLATQCYTAYSWLPGMSEALRRLHPEVELRIVLEATRDPWAALEQRELDLAIVHTPSAAPGYACRVIGKDELLLVMAPSHGLASRKRLRPVDLHPYRFFTYDSSAAELAAQGEQTFPQGDAPRRVQCVPLTEALVHLVRSGQGVSLLSARVARPYLERGELVSRPLSNARLRRTWRAVYPNGSSLQAALHDVVAFLVDDPLW